MAVANDYVIRSVSEYIEKFALQKGTTFYNRNTNIIPIFRGQANKNWELCPSIYRNDSFKSEANFIHEMERMLPSEFVGLTYIEKMIKMQHYGLPTRLLDFTLNPLVALFFACNSSAETDGIVSCVHGFRLHPENFVWLSIATKAIFEYNLTNFPIETFINELKTEPGKYPVRDVEPFYTKAAILKILTNPIGIYPKLNNTRIMNQDGVFVLFGMSIHEGSSSDHIVFDKVIYKTPESFFKHTQSCIIPAENKKGILRDLDYLGINERKLFPDISNLAKYIPSYFLNRKTL